MNVPPSTNAACNTNAAAPMTLADRLLDLGNVDTSRIRMQPPPGTATLEDLIRISSSDDRLYELVDGTLVEKTVGWQESVLAIVLARWLGDFVEQHDLGIVGGADGFTRLFGDTIRSADVAFVSWQRLPGGRIPADPVPNLVPDFVIEVLSLSNTYGEMSRKRREYFHAGVRLLWLVDPRRRTVTVYRDALHPTVINEDGSLSGGDVLPGWTVDLAKLFESLDREAP